VTITTKNCIIEGNLENHENEMAIDREDCINQNTMDSIVDGTIPI